MKVSCPNPNTWLTLFNSAFLPCFRQPGFQRSHQNFQELFGLRVSLSFCPSSHHYTLDGFVSYLHCGPQHWLGRGESEAIKRSLRARWAPGEEGGGQVLILFVQVHCNAACGVNIFHFITPGPGPGPGCSPGPCLGWISAVPGLWKAAVTERKTNEVAINISAHCPTKADGHTRGAGRGRAWLGPPVPPWKHLNPQGLLSTEPNLSN